MKQSTPTIPPTYLPLAWPPTSKLTAAERAHVDRERRSLWKHGIRREPMLTRMAFEFGAVAAMLERKGATPDTAPDSRR